MSPLILLFFKILLVILSPLTYCMNFRIILSIIARKSTILWKGLHWIGRLISWVVLHHKNVKSSHPWGRMLFHLFRSLISFSNVLYFSVYKHYTLKCYLYLFDIFCYYCKWDCFLIFIFGLFVTCDFCTLSLYPGTKLNLIISTNSFYWISLDFLHTRSSHLQREIVSILPQGRLEVSDWYCLFSHIFSAHAPRFACAYGLFDPQKYVKLLYIHLLL